MNKTYILGKTLLVESSLIIEPTLLTSLEQSLVIVQQRLQNFASDAEFAPKMAVAFGVAAEVDSLKTAWSVGDFGVFPEIEIRQTTELDGANGAYANATNRIYLSWDFLQANQGNVESIAGLLLEEIGHRVDVVLNKSDSAGDEGAIFSALVQGENLSSQELQQFKAEDDKAVITLDGQSIEIEKQDFTGTTGNDVIVGTAGDDVIQGLGGNDTLNGLAGNDSLIGDAGNDSLYGEAGNDTLDGGDGDDYLNPGTGVDQIDGGAGNDGLFLDLSASTTNIAINFTNATNGTVSNGTSFQNIESFDILTGSGDDTITTAQTTGATHVRSGAGNDTIQTGSGKDKVEGGDGDDTIRGGAGDDSGYETYAGSFQAIGLYGGNGNDRIFGEAGNDALYGEAGNDILDGGEGDDYLNPGTGVDQIDGGAGNDGLFLDLSASTTNIAINFTNATNGTVSNGTSFQNIESFDILTGSGDDTITTAQTTGATHVRSGAGNDTIQTGSGKDKVEGGDGDDTIRGGAGDDSGYETYAGSFQAIGLYGGNGNDRIFGEAGNDALYGEAGNDILDGGDGDDYLNPGTGVDQIDGGAGNDGLFLDLSASTTNIAINFTNATNGTVSNGTSFQNIESFDILTGSGDDTITTAQTTGATHVRSGAGNDTIQTGSGKDKVEGGDGDDTIRGGAGDDSGYESYAGSFQVIGLYGGNGNDRIFGEAGNDALYGEAGNDTLDGGDGDDYLNPGTGVDQIDGGAGNDGLFLDLSASTTNIAINFTNATNGTVSNGTSFQNIESFDILTGSGDDTITTAQTTGATHVRSGAGNDTIQTGSGKDKVEGGDGDDTIRGGAGDDSGYESYAGSFQVIGLYGGNGNDRIFGEAGNDALYGEAGNDTLDGGDGDDYLNPGTGVDQIDGGAGNDGLFLDLSASTTNIAINFTNATNGTVSNGTSFQNIESFDILTGSGDDTITTAQTTGATHVRSGAGNDTIQTGSGKDKVEGGDGDDTIRGGAGDDSGYESYAGSFQVIGLYGGNGNDRIFGEAGNDALYGEAGNDTLIGVDANSSNPGIGEIDNLTGGMGSDRFILGDAANIYYDDRNTSTNGNNDYATITDFNPLEDKIQLRGLASNYRLEISGVNTNLYVDKTGSEPDELIADFENVTGLNLTSNAFEYIAPVDVNPTSTVQFGSATYTVNESEAAQVTLLRSGNTSGQTSLTVFLSNGTANAPADYSNAPIAVTFNNGETSKTVTVPIVDDTIFEPNETINLALTNLSNDTNLGTQNTAVLTIIDNDVAQPGTISFTSNSYSVNENGIPIQAVTLTRTGGSDGIVSVAVTASNGTATAPADYDSNPVTVTFANGETSKTVAIPIVNDSVYEGNETVNLTITNPTGGATLGTQNTTTLTIVDNDSPQQGTLAFSNPTYSVNEDGTPITAVTVTRTGGSDGEVSATISLSDGSATSPQDYTNNPITVTFANGDTTVKTVTIPIVNDTVLEGTETINLSLTNPTGGATIGSQNTAVVAIADDDIQLNFSTANYTVQEDGTAVTDIIVTRTGRTTGAVSANITFTDGTAIGCGCAASSVNNDFYNGGFTITLADGETSKVIPVELASLGGSNAIRIRNDSKVEGDETFTINLTNPTGGATIGNQGSASVKILDDDVALAFSAANFSVRENGEAITAVTVTRAGRLTGVVGATINLTDGTATAPSDYNNTPIVISFAEGETSKTVYIPINNDITVEPDETVTLSLSNPTGGATIGTQDTAVLKIVDNGQAPTLGVSINKDIVAESAGNAAAVGTVTRNFVNNQDLVVTLSSSDTTEATVPTQVTILANQASATFNINAVDDGVADGAQTAIITASATGFSSGSRSLTVTDINLPDLVVSNLSATTPLLSGKQAFFSYKVENKGLAQATATEENSSIDRVYLSTDNKLDSSDTQLNEFQFKGNFPVGQFYERNVAFFVPKTTGQYYLIAQTDATNVINEGGSIGDNNNTTILPISVAAAYRAIVSTDTEIGIAGQSVLLKGQALSNADNSPIPYEFVTIAVKNNGFVRELSALTDGNGNFTSTFKPLAGEGGQYQINAYFPNNPSEDTAPEDSFKLLGMRFGSNNASHKVIADKAFTTEINLENLTDIALNGLTYTVEGAPSNWNIQVNTPATLAGLGKNTISYTITAPNNSDITQDTFNIKLTSAEGVTATLPVSVNLERIVPRLVASTNLVSSGMLRGNQTAVEFEVKNEGGAVAENIQVGLPDASWLKLASPTKINSLAPGESTKVTLLLTPEADLALTEYKGNIFLDAAGNDGDLSLPFNFRAVSNAVGEIRINTADELTYFAEGTPKLANATVTLRNYFTNEVIASTVTDETGMINLSNINEGFYKLEVTADNHDTFRQTIQLDAGEIENVNAFLSRQTVKYIWNVTPTEIQDKYNISVESVFETNVPVPTLTIDPPLIDLADLDVVGEVKQIDMTITNHGLIAANNVRLNFGEHPFYKIEPLIEDAGTLSAKSSLTIPVRITRVADFDTLNLNGGDLSVLSQPSVPCGIYGRLDWSYVCGYNSVYKSGTIAVNGVVGNCPPGFASFFGSGSGSGSDGVFRVTVDVSTSCNPESALSDCLLRFVTLPLKAVSDCLANAIQCAGSAIIKYNRGEDPTSGLILCTPLTIYSCYKNGLLGGGVINLIQVAIGCGIDFLKPKVSVSSETLGLLQEGLSPSSASQQALDLLQNSIERLEKYISPFQVLFGNDVWLKSEDYTGLTNWLDTFFSKISETNFEDAKISSSEREEIINIPLPNSITGSDINRFIDRWNRSVDYWNNGIIKASDVPIGQSTDFLAIDTLFDTLNAAIEVEQQSEAEGFINVTDEFKYAVDQIIASENSSNGVCAKVKIRLDQDAVMTRSAFLGDLEIDNGNTTNLSNLTVTLQVKDAQGKVVNDLFGITNPTLKNITAVDGTGILTGDNPNTPQDEGIGSAEWTFIPTNLAAPEVPTQYSIGGTLSYTENGQLISVPLLSTPITVYPQAELHLDYFHQRDVYADDPFTDRIEPSVPYSLAVLVKNEGKGDAKNLKITSAQPKIVDNEKGLLIDFQIIGSQVNGNDVTPSLSVDFGNIGAGKTAVADWLLKSSLQGKFIDYKATFEHVNSLGNPELSLIKDVKIHELTHQVRATDDNLPDFLVNDTFDANFDPDTLYFSSGGTAPVKVVTNATTDGAATFDDLTVQVSATLESGWTYLRLNDPGNGQFQIKKVLRSDGTALILDDVWTTDRTFPATGRPTYENILHLLDNNATAGTQTYTITYSTGDQTPPKVREIVDVDPNPRNTPVNSLDVVFTEPIKTATFDASDINLTLDGVAVNTNNLSITPVNTNTYRIGNLQGITGNVGQYQLSVNAAGVQDFEGLSGVGVVNESWVFTGDRPAVSAIAGFTSNRLKTPVDTVTVTFTEAINPSSFDFNDLFLNKDGGGNLIKNTVTINQIDASSYQINHLGDLTNVDGEYSFLINARGVTDTDGNTGVGGKGFTWTLDTNAPKLQSITDVTSPRNTKVSNLDIAFSKPIDSTSFDLSDVILTFDGTTNLITNSVSLTQLNNTTYRLNGLTALQTTDGSYNLTVVGSGIKDTSGNIVTNSLAENWTLDTIAPNAATNVQVTGNFPSQQTNSSGQIRVNSTSIKITGSLDETGLKVYVRDKNLNQSLGQATVNGTNFNSAVQLSGAGARELEIQVVDAAGNTTTTPLSLFADITAPALLKFSNLPQQPVTNPINFVDLEFSEVLNLSTFNYQDITLTRDGGTNLITNAVTIEYLSDNKYRINGLDTLTQTPGTYNLQINTPGIQDLAGNAGIEPNNTTFTIQGAATPGVTIAESNGSTNVTEGGATDSYTVVLKTQPTADVTLSLNVGNQITTDKTTLTFTSANWNLPQTITVTAVNDTIPEGNHTAIITHSTSSNDNNYNSLTLPNINVAIQDNDAEIRGTVWNDINGDGVKANTEPTLPNWTVYLDTNNNSQLDAGETFTVTDAQGTYTFNDLRPGSYTVAQVVQDGWKQTHPVINVTTTASSAEIFTPSETLSTSNTPATTATHLINLDDFQADPRFANIKGQGYATVIIDTGIDLDSPFFGPDNNHDGIDDRIIYQYDFADKDNNASDSSGHGSHVASIAASIAPDANIIALKVFKDNGSGYFSDLEAALQWVNKNAYAYHIASVNLSVGDGQNWSTGNSRYGIGDELAAIASKNIIIAAAAGNSFYQFNSNPGVAYPAADPNTIAVGAVWTDNLGGPKTFNGGAIDYTTDSDRIASFSQRHPTLLDVFAPGIQITGANATGGTQSMSGTSQAAPFISGIAVLAQQIAQEKLGREITLGEFRTLLDNTSVLINDGDNENDNVTNTGLNFPRVNVLALAEGILNLNSQTPNPSNSNANANSSNDPLYLPSSSVKLTHTVTLTAGQIATDIDFGNQRLNNAPTLRSAIADQTATKDTSFTFTIPENTFADVDAGDILTYTATLENSNTLPTWLTFDAATHTFSGTPTEDASGNYNITVTATDTATANVSDTFTLKVLNLFNGTSDSDHLTGTDKGDYLDAREGRDVISAGKGDDVLVGGIGGDILTGGEGNDQFVYTNIRDRGDTITDFEVGKDSIVMTQLLDSLVAGGYNGTNAIADGYVQVVQGSSAGNFSVEIDSDGVAAGDIFRPFITVNLANSGTLNSSSNFVF